VFLILQNSLLLLAAAETLHQTTHTVMEIRKLVDLVGEGGPRGTVVVAVDYLEFFQVAKVYLLTLVDRVGH